MIVRILSSVFFTDIGAKERYIGYLNFLGIPWNLKFLWSPFVDALGTKRGWLLLMQLAISILTAIIAVLCLMVPGIGDANPHILAMSLVFVAMAFAAATNDIAIDAYYMEGLTDPKDQAAYSGYRVVAYRVSMIFARSGLVALAAALGAYYGPDKYSPWAYAFGAGAATMLGLTLFHTLRLPRFEARRDRPKPMQVIRSYGRAFATYIQQDRIALVLAFIALYKLGDEIMFSMITPFLMREIGVTKAQYAWIGGIVGAAASIGGAMLGAYWIEKKGLRKAMWPITLLMNLNIGVYIWFAYAKPNPATTTGLMLVAAIHGYEQVAAGLGNSALVLYLLTTCKAEFKAAHYAIGSAIMSLGGTLVGGFGGQLVERIGYLHLFTLALISTIPSMLLLFVVPLRDHGSTT